MFAEVPTILTDLGIAAGALVGIATLIGLLSRARPVRWVWRQLIGAPVSRWLGGIVSDQVEPVATEVRELSVQLVNHMGAEEGLRSDDIANRDRRQEEIDAWRTEVRDDIAGVRGDIRTVHGRIDDALGALAAGNPEVRQH